jgi:hypothetical protein
MQKIVGICLLFMGISLAGMAQDTPELKATYQVGAARITVWKHETKEGKSWESYKIEKVVNRNGILVTSHSFSPEEMLQLIKPF